MLVGGNFQKHNHDQSRLKDLVIVGIGRRGFPSFYVRHSQQTDRMLDRRSQATSCVFFFLPLVTLKSLASVGAGAKGFASLALITRESVWQSVANS